MVVNAGSVAPVQYSFNFTDKAHEVLNNRNLTPESIFKRVFDSVFKLQQGPTPEHNDQVEPLIEGASELFIMKIDEQYALHYKVVENEKKFVVFWIGRFN